VENTERIA